ncbi:UPF0462 protein C4orf33 homolog [Exaiptasia diaphana]|uniref:ShKT domain-containing protein n=1 Tax=Exaiptasia diaphana TaxID=2652724 RepID=A0A913Y9M6_EXADI|nr:UPF0462 protein C4orf33 homolog [Exaiptasia diaphana]
MKEYCRKTCNFCSPTVAIPKCRDKRKRKCKRYAKFQGYCTVYKDYMSEMCPRSCRFCGVAVVNKKIAYKVYNEKYEFAIKTMWDGSPINHDPIKIKLSAEDNLNVRLEVSGPFFDQPGKPPCLAGQPCWRLWEYEVAEVFFLGDKQKYLELEVSPHGPHLLLLLDGVRKPFKTKLPMRYSATIDNIKKTWNGTAIVPIDYFPPNMRKINAYAIHGPDNSKVYQALYPAKGTLHPDFHQLKFFQDFDFKSMFPQAWTAQPMSPFWVDRN